MNINERAWLIFAMSIVYVSILSLYAFYINDPTNPPLLYWFYLGWLIFIVAHTIYLKRNHKSFK